MSAAKVQACFTASKASARAIVGEARDPAPKAADFALAKTAPATTLPASLAVSPEEDLLVTDRFSLFKFLHFSCMKLNHLNLCTSNVSSLRDIFTQHFAFKTLEFSENYATLRGSDGFFLVLTKIASDSPTLYPNSLLGKLSISFHVGFMLELPAEVHAKHQELSEAGRSPGPVNTFETSGATWTAFYCAVGDGIDIEVNAHVPQMNNAEQG